MSLRYFLGNGETPRSKGGKGSGNLSMLGTEVYQLRQTTQKRGLEELLLAQGQGQRLRVPGCIGTGAAERSCPTSEVRAEAGRSYHMPEVRGCG